VAVTHRLHLSRRRQQNREEREVPRPTDDRQGDELKTLTASVMADPGQRDAVLTVSTTTGWNGPRKAGWDNDVANYGAISCGDTSSGSAIYMRFGGSVTNAANSAASAGPAPSAASSFRDRSASQTKNKGHCSMCF